MRAVANRVVTGQDLMAYPSPPPFEPVWGAITLRTLSDRNATVAAVGWFQSGDHRTFSGSAKREPGDAYDPETGQMLATARALRRLANHLELTARYRVVKAEARAVSEMDRALRRADRKAHPPQPKPRPEGLPRTRSGRQRDAGADS
jgi:hypothetical protein